MISVFVAEGMLAIVAYYCVWLLNRVMYMHTVASSGVAKVGHTGAQALPT